MTHPLNQAMAPIVMLLLAGWVFSPTATGADVSAKAGASVDSRELINYLFLHDYQSGPYKVGNETALTLKVTPRYTARDFREKGWGLLLRLELQFGYHLIKALENGFLEKDNLQSVSAVPGIELPILATEDWVITPRQEFGVGTSLQGGDEVYTSQSTLRNVFTLYPIPKRVWLSLDAKYGVVLAGNEQTDRDYFNVSLRADAVEPFSRPVLKKHQPTLNPFIKAGYYFDAMHFDQGDGSEPIELREEYEVGVKFSTEPRIKVLGIGMPRLSISFQWGSGLKALKIRL